MRRNNQFTVLFLSFLYLYLFSEAATSLNKNSHYNFNNHIADYLDIEDLGEFEIEEIDHKYSKEDNNNEAFFKLNSNGSNQNQIEIQNYFHSKFYPQLRSKANIIDLSKSEITLEENSNNNEDDDDILNENLLSKLNDYKIKSNIFEFSNSAILASVILLVISFLLVLYKS